MSAPALSRAARVRPPAGTNDNEVSLTGAAAIAAQSVFANMGDAKQVWVSIAINVAFNIEFGASGVGAPADTGVLAAGLYEFEASKGAEETHFRIMPNANGELKWWVSSR